MKYTLKLKLWNSEQTLFPGLDPGEIVRYVVEVRDDTYSSMAISLQKACDDMIEHYIHVEVEECQGDT